MFLYISGVHGQYQTDVVLFVYCIAFYISVVKYLTVYTVLMDIKLVLVICVADITSIHINLTLFLAIVVPRVHSE